MWWNLLLFAGEGTSMGEHNLKPTQGTQTSALEAGDLLGPNNDLFHDSKGVDQVLDSTSNLMLFVGWVELSNIDVSGMSFPALTL